MSSPVPDVVRVLTTSHCYLPGERCRVKRDSHVTWKMVTLMSRLTCQWPSSSPHWRPRISPLVAIFFPRWWPRISPPTDRLGFGVLGEWFDPLPGCGLRESVAVLPVGDQDVRVME